jgi:hypothetical protein
MDHWIQRAFGKVFPQTNHQALNLRLHELAQDEVEHDIEAYFEDTFARIRCDHPDGDSLADWPTTEQKTDLIEKTGVLFIFASTVSRFLSDERFSPRIKLDDILCKDSDRASASPYKFLDDLYLRVLSASLGDHGDPSYAALIQSVVATVVLAAAPLTIDTISEIVGQDAHAVLRCLSSVLLVPAQPLSSQEPVRTFHPSFHDFLTNNSRCTDPRFVVNSKTEHCRIAVCCFKRMYDGLRYDVCDIRDPFLFNKDVPDLNDRIARYIPVVLRYACENWHFHLLLASRDPALMVLFSLFCEERLLFWIEATSLLTDTGAIHLALWAMGWYRCVRSNSPSCWLS